MRPKGALLTGTQAIFSPTFSISASKWSLEAQPQTFPGAIAILGYKAAVNNDGSGWQIIPVAIAFGIPIVIAFIIVTSRSALRGELNVNQLARGDFK